MQYKTTIEKYFKAWQIRDWNFVEAVITDDFTFTSPYDAAIDRETYKTKCWDSVKEIGEFEIITIVAGETEAFVRYKNRINGENALNVEHFIFENDKVKSVTVFFGLPE